MKRCLALAILILAPAFDKGMRLDSRELTKVGIGAINTIIFDIRSHMEHYTDQFGWYVGVAANPEYKLFGAHGVDRKYGAWIYRNAGSSLVAREIERYFLDTGLKGSQGRFDYSSIYIYAYRIETYTKEQVETRLAIAKNPATD